MRPNTAKRKSPRVHTTPLLHVFSGNFLGRGHLVPSLIQELSSEGSQRAQMQPNITTKQT
eukprot:6415554-Amphidinium_carterae.1